MHLGSAYAGARESAVNESRHIAKWLSVRQADCKSRGDGFGNAMRNSGAGRVLLPYRVHRAGYADAVQAAQSSRRQRVAIPVVGIDVTGEVLTVTFADGTTETHTLPSGRRWWCRPGSEGFGSKRHWRQLTAKQANQILMMHSPHIQTVPTSTTRLQAYRNLPLTV